MGIISVTTVSLDVLFSIVGGFRFQGKDSDHNNIMKRLPVSIRIYASSIWLSVFTARSISSGDYNPSAGWHFFIPKNSRWHFIYSEILLSSKWEVHEKLYTRPHILSWQILILFRGHDNNLSPYNLCVWFILHEDRVHKVHKTGVMFVKGERNRAPSWYPRFPSSVTWVFQTLYLSFYWWAPSTLQVFCKKILSEA